LTQEEDRAGMLGRLLEGGDRERFRLLEFRWRAAHLCLRKRQEEARLDPFSVKGGLGFLQRCLRQGEVSLLERRCPPQAERFKVARILVKDSIGSLDRSCPILS